MGESPGGQPSPLLCSCVGCVNAVLVHQHRHAAQRCDAIGDRQCAGFLCGFANRLGLIDTFVPVEVSACTKLTAICGCSRRIKIANLPEGRKARPRPSTTCLSWRLAGGHFRPCGRRRIHWKAARTCGPARRSSHRPSPFPRCSVPDTATSRTDSGVEQPYPGSD